ncbi:patatin-like protein [Novosphingobium cyanobacteriorum]|uniref:Patatin-like protein n=1 Tax=Novosphingobium cyanobacteriorum TaxID=3024215 RepID=A0ABT6CJG2_9SPHN|nr:patatin-like protein [Novosphingobium cyanobacteriorum]MDF8334056.1 patatin-like protein [Novosphingobium cyanobacteriorum]
MRQKELRVALVCFGGISLAVYMHGVTREIWHATRASRALHRADPPNDPRCSGVEGVYRRLLETVVRTRGLKLRFLPDIVSGASAGGINGVFLAQALATGQSLAPLTRLWLEKADIDVLLDPDAKPWSRFAKLWAQPIVWLALRFPGSVVSRTVAQGTRAEVRRKVSRLIRARWFAPPFSGIGFSHLIAEALEAMAASDGDGEPLLPPAHPLDLQVTATDFNGHPEELHLNSPPVVEESEHRLAIGFRHAVARNQPLAHAADLVFAARATASFPGAFPPLMVDEIDRMARERGIGWPGRDAFLQRIMPSRWKRGQIADAALVDGAVLVNRPFAQAMAVLRDRPAQREVDRRFVYIDPSPDHMRLGPRGARSVGFFSAIFGSLSSIPREQPIRDNLETIEQQSRERARLRAIVDALRPEVEHAVEKLFGHTLFFDSPTQRRLTSWRNKAQQAAAEQAGFAFHGYAQVKLGGIVADLAEVIFDAAPQAATRAQVEAALWNHVRALGLDHLSHAGGGASPEAIAFFRTHDVAFRIRRLKLLARRLTHDWDEAEGITDQARDAARDVVYRAQALYQGRQTAGGLGPSITTSAPVACADPAAVLGAIASARNLTGIDLEVDAMIVGALAGMDKPLRRRFLHAYLGFPFYDIATLPLLQGEGMGEFDPIRIDRISPDDATAIRKGGTLACLRGVEFFNFGAFFSRAYRENDYLWGRLHGAERTLDLLCSTVQPPLDEATIHAFKRDAFLAILEEEKDNLKAEPGMVDRVIEEVRTAFAE